MVGWSIIGTEEDKRKKVFEPNVPSFESRFKAMKEIADAGITTGTVFMPILPFIYDDDASLEAVVMRTKEAGGKFVLAAALTLEQNTELKRRYLELIAKHYPKLLNDYEILFRGYGPPSSYWSPIQLKIDALCQKYGLLNYIPRPVKFWPQDIRINKEIANKFHLKAKELQFYKKDERRGWAYRRAAWALDELDKGVAEIYKKSWLAGLQKIDSIGNRLAHLIENELKARGIER